jgi:hypothetical protein
VLHGGVAAKLFSEDLTGEEVMRRLLSIACVLLLAAMLNVSTGCGKGPKKGGGGGDGDGDGDGEVTPDKVRALAKATGWATIKGKVTYDGTAPARVKNAELFNNTDCAKVAGKATEDENSEQLWLVTSDGEVENVAVWIEPEAGKYFDIDDKEKDRTGKSVVVDQPHCAYVPHVITVFPSYYDPKSTQTKDARRQKKTGEKLIYKNSAGFNHNVRVSAQETISPQDRNLTHGNEAEILVQPMPKPINVACSVHNFMNGKILAFEHPYAAVTGKDGTFAFKAKVPAGVPLKIMAYHEALDKFSPDGFAEPITLKDGETKEVNFKIKKK